MSHTTAIFWFRRDLRLSDNPALLEALRHANGSVVATFVLDDALLAPAGATRSLYLRRTLEALDASLGGSLVVRRGDPASELRSLARECHARALFATEDFAPLGRARDARVAAILSDADVETTFVASPYVVSPGTVRTAAGTPCRVFGAFERGWLREPLAAPLGAPRGVQWHDAPSVSLDEIDRLAATRRPEYFGDLPDSPAPSLPLAGENAGVAALSAFARRVVNYEAERDLPGRDSTSHLSAFLRFGALHPRQVLSALEGTSRGYEKFRAEVCWREFYADVLWHHPESARETLQPTMRRLRYDTDLAAQARFRTWALGETGYPLVDAGMRQLLEEGWIHNRVRMVAASFLVKHLHLDWRWGARWFMWRLVDADLASNQHGWQWVAGTGTDASPFHRIFNPTRQAKRFDPEGEYVHRYVETLRAIPAPACLEPGGGASMFASGYVAPMVELEVERREALVRFAEARELTKAVP